MQGCIYSYRHYVLQCTAFSLFCAVLPTLMLSWDVKGAWSVALILFHAPSWTDQEFKSPSKSKWNSSLLIWTLWCRGTSQLPLIVQCLEGSLLISWCNIDLRPIICSNGEGGDTVVLWTTCMTMHFLCGPYTHFCMHGFVLLHGQVYDYREESADCMHLLV